MPTASLPMYDLPEAKSVTDAWWQGLAAWFSREGIKDVPRTLTRGLEFAELWRMPDLLFSQTCGYPLTHAFRDDLSLVATPVYAVPGCRESNYCSYIMVREDDTASGIADLKGRVAACNGPDSQSGYSALRAVVAPVSGGAPFFDRVTISGSHAKSLEMVARGEADVCATDGVTFSLLARFHPAVVAGLRRLTESPPAPALPYVTKAGVDDDTLGRLRAGLFGALGDPALAESRTALFIDGAKVLPISAYDRILEIEREARDLGYPKVA